MQCRDLPKTHRGYVFLSDYYLVQHDKILEFFLYSKVPCKIVFPPLDEGELRGAFRVYVPEVYLKPLLELNGLY